jgi:Cu/Ag efflux protein CusF
MNSIASLQVGIFLALAACFGTANAQHHHHHSNTENAEPNPAAPYAGQQLRSIKALSDQEQRDLEEGKGLGLAKAAELNGYPGPMHVLEHADALQLSVLQRTQTQELLVKHKRLVSELGKQLVQKEVVLDKEFLSRQIQADSLVRLTKEIGLLQAEIRAEHLMTHLKQTALLSSSQISQYNALRGYAKTANATVDVPNMTDAEVRKIDVESKKITLKHAEIKNLDMPGMTMVFKVQDPKQLGQLKVGDKVKFKAEKVNGDYVVTDIQMAK